MIDLPIVRQILAPFAPKLIYLFGSVNAGHARHDSDLDLAILCDRPVDAYRLFLAAQKIAGEIGREVDLLDLSTASAVMKAEIVTTGKLLWAADEELVDVFEMYVLSAYAQANEDRWEALRDYGIIIR